MNKLGIIGIAAALASIAGSASAGTITKVGAVKALTNTSQILGSLGAGNFDEGPTSGNVPLGVYSAQGLTWRTGALSTILPGVSNTGSAYQPQYVSEATYSGYFPAPIGGGGTHAGQFNFFAGVATFSVTVTQVGLTASKNGTQYLTAFNSSGMMIGQVTWVPSNDSTFVGIDTLGVPIAMIAYGNHDLWAGQPYDIGGSTIMSDSWIWATGKCTTNAECNDGNPCTTDTCNAVGACVNTNNTIACDDGNACTMGDTCSAGSCSGTPVTCSPLDQCHTAGTCNPATGTCSNPNQMDGTTCNDGNACTQADACQAGVCAGTNAVTCTALDGCHDVGVCNPATGQCSNPNKMDGSACSDSNACTQTDTCVAGVCSGMMPVVCATPDQCHDAGVCDTTSGMCSNPAKADGSACDDNNKCTTSDQCTAGVCTPGTPKTCAPSDQCHDAGACDPATGNCSNPNKMNGAACDDNDKCTTSDQCNAGACVGGTPVTCTPADSCHEAGTCDPATGSCSSPAKPDGTPCELGTCTAGKCSASGTGGAGGSGSTSTGSGTGGGGGAGGGSGSSGGCGCRAAGGEDPVGVPWALVAAAGVVTALRRRKSRGARD